MQGTRSELVSEYEGASNREGREVGGAFDLRPLSMAFPEVGESGELSKNHKSTPTSVTTMGSSTNVLAAGVHPISTLQAPPTYMESPYLLFGSHAGLSSSQKGTASMTEPSTSTFLVRVFIFDLSLSFITLFLSLFPLIE
jgi:hypothetical protein